MKQQAPNSRLWDDIRQSAFNDFACTIILMIVLLWFLWLCQS